MRRIVLDTSVLISHWRNCRQGEQLSRLSQREVRSWTERLIKIEDTDSTLSPVVVEFLAGVGDQTEMVLARIYLDPLTVVDKGRILKADWNEARRLAERVPRSRRPRDMGDCLIRAIARRLNYDVRTFDTGMPK